ncbi:MAG: 1-pyrroline-5-carboxylate dehydrogenase [Elusimicrobia bacterium]|nr:MAG: 1-pyrroline-5-carboxylate dehydrogenase [Elusimicrobiota bacterium]
MSNAIFRVPEPVNESIKTYAPGTPERAELKAKLKELASLQPDIPMVIGGRPVRTGKLGDCRPPHESSKLLGRYHIGNKKHALDAIKAAQKAKTAWAATPFHDRAAVFLRAAELLAGPWRQVFNAATMHTLSKNVFQAEIDAVCELIDFWRFNVKYAQDLYEHQPTSQPGMWNRVEYRALEGFVFAVSPFNFTSIAGNLPTAPALMGNTVVWKPCKTTMFAAHFIMELLHAAGLPDGVINMVTGNSSEIGTTVIDHPDLAGVHFTGSTPVFQWMWKRIGENIARYKTYPRLVGETGGKNFVFMHASADLDNAATALTRGAFEYQGQKCSAASRAYIPESQWPKLMKKMEEQLGRVKMGHPQDMGNFMNAVIDKASYENITSYFPHVTARNGAKFIFGGKASDKKGYFIEPTVIKTTKHDFITMREELFGPVLTVYTYPEKRYAETLKLCDKTSPYALTGSVLARERSAISQASEALMHAAGNFYVNDKPTGAVVGQQPFGGSRASGTNDKAGSFLNLVRWVSTRTTKELFVPPSDFTYPFMSKN